MKKNLILFVTLILIIVTGIFAFILINNDRSFETNDKMENNNVKASTDDNLEQEETNEKVEKLPKEEKETTSQDDVNEDKKVVQEKSTSTKNTSSNNTNKKDSTKPKIKSNNQTTQKKNSSTSSVKSSSKTEWEKLGISENDYYNSPANKSMTIDFAISKYGNKENARKACYEKGEQYSSTEAYSFTCVEVNSYSGKMLGYHIIYVKI